MKSSKTVFITGTSSGLGYGLAHHYLMEGWGVIGCSRREASQDLLDNESYEHIQIDLSESREKVEALVDKLAEKEGLELVILNAGVLGEIKDLQETSLDDLKQIFDVNLWANKVLIDLLASRVKSLKQVVGISSGASVNGNRGWGGYSLSKAALNMLIKVYAKEFENIHFTSLAPGLIDTSMQDYLTGLPDGSKFGSIDRLKAAKGTSDMPEPREAGMIIAKAIKESQRFSSGEFLDVRKDFN